MKQKILAGLLAGLMLISLAGCGNKKGGNTLKEGKTLQNMADQVVSEVGFEEPGDVDEQLLSSVYGIDMETVDTFAGKTCMSAISSDNFIAIKAKEGKADTVKKALEEKMEGIKADFKDYVPAEKVKADAGKILVKGDYVFLIILGNDKLSNEEAVKKGEEIVNSYFA